MPSMPLCNICVFIMWLLHSKTRIKCHCSAITFESCLSVVNKFNLTVHKSRIEKKNNN